MHMKKRKFESDTFDTAKFEEKIELTIVCKFQTEIQQIECSNRKIDFADIIF